VTAGATVTVKSNQLRMGTFLGVGLLSVALSVFEASNARAMA
jgi:hypothetical protein